MRKVKGTVQTLVVVVVLTKIVSVLLLALAAYTPPTTAITAIAARNNLAFFIKLKFMCLRKILPTLFIGFSVTPVSFVRKRICDQCSEWVAT
ncbi:hypothetical protein DBR11_05010 [Pedobacter sp. HMWF019]|nr:hypothetical protein DBR11_05010 [Pedobacter sp. HMWF019]